MAVVNSQAVVNTVEMYGVTAIRLASTLGTNLNQIIKSLFANNAQGFVYNPHDLSTMFQDSVGTVPVTAAGQPVGLILDKSGRGNHAYQTTSAARPLLQQIPLLGSDITVNGDFNSGLDDNWLHTAGGWSANGGVVTSSGTISGLSFLTNLNSLSVGDTAKIVIKVANKGTKGSLGVAFGDGATDHKKWTVSEMGSLTELSWAAVLTNNNRIYITTRDGWDGSIDKVEIRKVTGYSTDRPYIDYDAVDDKLVTTLPAQLVGCTVVRAVPNVGTQILTNQTIPTPYNDNTDHCGLIVINRALTATETSQITKLFNKASGVTLSV